MKYITKHSELLKLHGRKVSCKLNGKFIDDARISCDDKHAYLCQNKQDEDLTQEMFEYKYAICLSYCNKGYHEHKYEDSNGGVTEIQLVEEPKEKKKNKHFGSNFDDDIDVGNKNDDEYEKEEQGKITHTLDSSNLLIGSRLWAFKMLDEGKKVRHKSWGKGVYIFIKYTNCYFFKTYDLVSYTGELVGFSLSKDGWEIYKDKEEPKKTMTFSDLIMKDSNIFNICDDKITWKLNGITQYYGFQDILMRESHLVEMIEEG